MIGAPLWQVAENGKPASLKILNVQKLLGQEPTRSRVDNMFNVLETETERRLNDDFNAPRIGDMLLIPIFSWPVKPKPAGDPTTFHVRWLMISSPDSWSRKV